MATLNILMKYLSFVSLCNELLGVGASTFNKRPVLYNIATILK